MIIYSKEMMTPKFLTVVGTLVLLWQPAVAQQMPPGLEQHCRQKWLTALQCPAHSISCAAIWPQIARCVANDMGYPRPVTEQCIRAENEKAYSRPSAYDQIPGVITCIEEKLRHG